MGEIKKKAVRTHDNFVSLPLCIMWKPPIAMIKKFASTHDIVGYIFLITIYKFNYHYSILSGWISLHIFPSFLLFSLQIFLLEMHACFLQKISPQQNVFIQGNFISLEAQIAEIIFSFTVMRKLQNLLLTRNIPLKKKKTTKKRPKHLFSSFFC